MCICCDYLQPPRAPPTLDSGKHYCASHWHFMRVILLSMTAARYLHWWIYLANIFHSLVSSINQLPVQFFPLQISTTILIVWLFNNNIKMVVTMDTKLPTEEELTVQELNLSGPALRAGSAHLGKYCQWTFNVSINNEMVVSYVHWKLQQWLCQHQFYTNQFMEKQMNEFNNYVMFLYAGCLAVYVNITTTHNTHIDRQTNR